METSGLHLLLLFDRASPKYGTPLADETDANRRTMNWGSRY